MRLKSTLQLAVTVMLVAYMLLVGATRNGQLLPGLQMITLAIMTVGVGGWLVLRWRGNWTWHRTPLDLVLVAWVMVFILSITANPETWRRSVEALWYMLFYIAVWYLLSDLFSNGVRRRLWLNAIFIVGMVQTPFVLAQIAWFYAEGGSGLPRPGGTTGNPNLLAAYYIVLIPLAVALYTQARNRFERLAVAGYVVICLLIQISTFSRGGWLGTAAALGVMGGFWLLMRGINSRETALAAWRSLSQPQRVLLGSTAVGAVIAAAGLVVVLIQSFAIAGRGAGLRTELWEAAFAMFQRSPLVGEGLFTYGYHLADYQSIPPEQPHSHAHNLPLQVLGEMGLVGLAVLVVTVVLGVRAARANWRALRGLDRWPFAAAVAALTGTGVHHLFDTPAMIPGIALMTLLLLAFVALPVKAEPLAAAWRRIGHPAGIITLWVGLLVVGGWQSSINARYYNTLADVVRTMDYPRAIAVLEEIIAQDPFNAAYRQQQAYLLGMAASTDEAYLERAIAAHAVLHTLEPHYAIGYANHAALLWQQNDRAGAQRLAQLAVETAPRWQLAIDQLAYYRGERLTPPRMGAAEAEFSLFAPGAVYFQMLRFIIVEELLPQIERP